MTGHSAVRCELVPLRHALGQPQRNVVLLLAGRLCITAHMVTIVLIVPCPPPSPPPPPTIIPPPTSLTNNKLSPRLCFLYLSIPGEFRAPSAVTLAAKFRSEPS